jgi:hypothetical protein
MIMGRGSNKEPTPDLFSPEKSGGAPTIQPAEPGINQPSRRAILPKDLPTAVRYLDDQELDRLVQAAIAEARRRGRPIQGVERPPADRPSARRKVEAPAASLTRGQLNAVRAAFKAGVRPSRIALQFGLSQSDVRKALAADEPGR